MQNASHFLFSLQTIWWQLIIHSGLAGADPWPASLSCTFPVLWIVSPSTSTHSMYTTWNKGQNYKTCFLVGVFSPFPLIPGVYRAGQRIRERETIWVLQVTQSRRLTQVCLGLINSSLYQFSSLPRPWTSIASASYHVVAMLCSVSQCQIHR